MNEEIPRAHVDVEVRYAETDQMGVVHHANYLIWFELARTRLCAMSGIHYADIEKLGYFMMVVGAHVRYRRGAKYGDQIQVISWVDHMGSRGMHFAYEVRRGDDLLATGKTEHLWVQADTGRPCKTPESVKEPFERLARPADG